MCGIYGVVYVGRNRKKSASAAQTVLEGLKRLEYRGYDSWGVAVVDAGAQTPIQIEKHIGKIGGVKKVELPTTAVALGHTRWATHGGVTEVNAHPHLASDGSFALVQNGVMENYQTVKAELIKEGWKFISQTDTEVIVHLLEKVRKQRPDSPVTFTDLAVAFQQLTGRNTVAILTKAGNLLAIRNGSPLIIAKNQQGDWFLSSDVVSAAADANQYYALASGEGVEIVDGQVRLFTVATLATKPLRWQPIDVQSLQLDKGGFAHFMRKEIQEQAEVLERPLQQPAALWQNLLLKLETARSVYTVGAGSADFVSNQIAFWLRQQGVVATAIKSYEARSYQNLINERDVCIAVSQSGETADTIEVIEWMKAAGVTIVSIVNMPGSTLTRLSDLPFMLQIGPEIGIASTKAVTAMMTWGLAIAWQLSGKPLNDFKKLVQAYQKDLDQWLKNGTIQAQLQKMANELIKQKDLFILGRGQLYMPALEFALKLKEISYIHAEGFSGGELKHGVIALIEKGTPVVCLVADDEEQADMLSAAAEVAARGARVIGVAGKNNQLFATWIPVPASQDFAALSSFIPAQLLTYYLALAKKLDPDKPRNLAKSVTVK